MAVYFVTSYYKALICALHKITDKIYGIGLVNKLLRLVLPVPETQLPSIDVT